MSIFFVNCFDEILRSLHLILSIKLNFIYSANSLKSEIKFYYTYLLINELRNLILNIEFNFDTFDLKYLLILFDVSSSIINSRIKTISSCRGSCIAISVVHRYLSSTVYTLHYNCLRDHDVDINYKIRTDKYICRDICNPLESEYTMFMFSTRVILFPAIRSYF